MASAPTCSPEISLGRYFWLLRFGTVAADLVNAQIGMGAVGQADRSRGAGNFLQRDDVGQVAQVSVPPYSSPAVMPSRPMSPNFLHRDRLGIH